jgi:hypothetical protein
MYRNLMGKLLGQWLFGRLERRWEDNIKMNFREVDFKDGMLI